MNQPLAPFNEIAQAIQDVPQGTALVLTKTPERVRLEGITYFLISALTPVITLLEKAEELTTRNITCALLAGIGLGLVSIKAFLSNSKSS